MILYDAYINGKKVIEQVPLEELRGFIPVSALQIKKAALGKTKLSIDVKFDRHVYMDTAVQNAANQFKIKYGVENYDQWIQLNRKYGNANK